MLNMIKNSFKKLSQDKIKTEIENINNGNLSAKLNSNYMKSITEEYKHYHNGNQILMNMFYNAHISFSSYWFISKLYRHYTVVLYVLNHELPNIIKLSQGIFANFSSLVPDEPINEKFANEIKTMINFVSKYEEKRETMFIDPTFTKASYQEQIRTANAVENLLFRSNGLYKPTVN